MEEFSKKDLLHFILGMLVAAVFAMPLNMIACIVPAVFAAFIYNFVGIWRDKGWDWWRFVYIILGGTIIQFLNIL